MVCEWVLRRFVAGIAHVTENTMIRDAIQQGL